VKFTPSLAAQKLVEQLAEQLKKEETLQDRAYDMLDIITGWCTLEIRGWY